MDKDRLMKLLRMAREATGNEASNAQAALERGLKAAGMTLADLENTDSKAEWYVFHYRNPMERRLLDQCAYYVLNTPKIVNRQGRSGQWEYAVTRAQYAEMIFVFTMMCDAMKKELDVFYTAFIHKHNLFPASGKDGTTPSTPEEIDNKQDRDMPWVQPRLGEIPYNSEQQQRYLEEAMKEMGVKPAPPKEE